MIIAVDIGGTKTLVARCRLDGTVEEQERFETPKKYADFKRVLSKYVAKIATSECTVVSVAVPGKIDRQTGVAIAFGNLDWSNVPIQDDLRNITKLPVLIENDANLAGLAEAHQLDPMPQHVLYVTISTGIGIGSVNGGVLDPDLLDSEGGSMLFEHEGRLQKWEHFASGKAIVARFGKKASEIEDPETWKIIARNIAVGLYNLCSVLEPEHVVIGGGVGTHFAKYKDFLLQDIQDMADPLVHIPPITQAVQPEEAVIRGCIIYARHHEQHH